MRIAFHRELLDIKKYMTMTASEKTDVKWENERDEYLLDEMKMLSGLYRKRSEYKRNRGWKSKRYKAIAYGLEKAMEILKRYGKELDLDL